MTKDHTLIERIDRLPHKVAVPFRQLYQSGQINEDVLRTVLDAGEIARDNAKLLGFTIAYMQHRADGVPVHDVIRMAADQQRRINLGWSAKRWKAEHDRLSRAEALDKLSMENTAYDLSAFQQHLPERFDGYLIPTSKRLGMEGLRQRHCVAAYHSKLQSGTCAIASIFADHARWTVELALTGNSEAPLRINQIKGRHNALPSAQIRDRIHDMLAIEVPKPTHGNRPATEEGRAYMDNLRRVLPVLREHGVEQVQVSFDGSGDEGHIGDIYYLPQREFDLADVTVQHVSLSSQFDDGRWVRTRCLAESPINDVIEELTDDYLQETGVDWYNNDGGFGELVINVQTGTVSLDIEVRFTESTTVFCTQRDIVTGEEI